MDTALIVVGVIAVGVLLIWVFTHMSDPKDIDEAEEAQVREKSPQEHERETFKEEAANAQSNADDIAFYSPGDTGDTGGNDE